MIVVLGEVRKVYPKMYKVIFTDPVVDIFEFLLHKLTVSLIPFEVHLYSMIKAFVWVMGICC